MFPALGIQPALTTTLTISLALVLTLASGTALSLADTPRDSGPEEPAMPTMPLLTRERATAFAELAMAGLFREYPNKPGNVHAGPDDVRTHREAHPAFFGSFDWHSSVHQHWMLVRLLERDPDAPIAPKIREHLARSLTASNLRSEAAFFEPEHNRSWERTYGWAWLLRLAAELRASEDPQLLAMAENLRPLEDAIVRLAMEFLPKLTWPIRTGQHPDTGFALAQFLDYARAVGNDELAELVVRRARDFYSEDRDYPTRYEPSGFDFFSSGLLEADLMRRVLPREEFSRWLDGFLPGLADGEAGNLLEPVHVSDVTDGKLVHLAGLDLVRAWTFRGIAGALPPDDPRVAVLEESAVRHAEVGLDYVFSGDYAGEHWLASFAVYLLDDAGLDRPSPASAGEGDR